MSRMQVASFNDVKVYNLSAGASSCLLGSRLGLLLGDGLDGWVDGSDAMRNAM